MRARTTLYLTSGFPGIVADLLMDDAFFASFRNKIFAVASDPDLKLRRAVGAPTLIVELSHDDGTPVGTLTWRFHRVKFGERVGEDIDASLPEWYRQALNLAATTIGPLPEAWLKALTAKEPDGVRRCENVPPDPPTMPQCPMAPQDMTVGPFFDPPSNCYNYACNVPAIDGQSAIPGRPDDEIRPESTPEHLVQACALDGLTPLESLPAECPAAAGHIVALINRPPNHNGFHFFRLNRDCTWSHKDGPAGAEIFDDSDPPRIIRSLTTAEFAYPFVFVGYFHCPENATCVN